MRLGTVDQWADENRVLVTSTSGEPGKYRTSRVPYLKDIYYDITPRFLCRDWADRETITDVVILKGAQVGATDLALNFIGYMMENYPGPDAIITPTVENSKKISKGKFDPMVANSGRLNKILRPARARDSGNEVRYKQYDGGSVVFPASQSAAQLRQMSLRFIVVDDYDGFAADADGEGSPDELLKNRQATFPDAMRIYISTPTYADVSPIILKYRETDMREFFIPCFNCKHMFVINWDSHMRWPRGKPHEAYVECPACSFHILDHHKEWFLQRGEWRAGAKAKYPGHRGYKLPSFYSPHGWESWGDLATMYVKGKNNLKLRKVFWMTKSAEGYRMPSMLEKDPNVLMNRLEKYDPEKSLPSGIVCLTAAVDVNIDWCEVTIDGWGRDDEYWNVWHEKIHGDPSMVYLADSPENVTLWMQVVRVLKKRFPHPRAGSMGVLATCVDTGGAHTHETYRFVLEGRRLMKKGTYLWAIKGRDEGQIWPNKITKTNPKTGFSIPMYVLGVSAAKDTIYDNISITKPGPCYRHYPATRDFDFFDQLLSEKKIPHEGKHGRTLYKWELPSHKRNEALDLAVYTLAAKEGLVRHGVILNAWDKRLDALALRQGREEAVLNPVKVPQAMEAAKPVTLAPKEQAPDATGREDREDRRNRRNRENREEQGDVFIEL